MFNTRGIVTYVLALIFLSGIKSHADTFVVTNLNDPGAGSLRQAIDDSNSNAGPDTIVFEEGLEGTIVLNSGSMFIQDDLTITGPGADKLTIDADEKSQIFVVNDFNDEQTFVVEISGLRLTDGTTAISNRENLTVHSCKFVNCNNVTTGEVAGTGGAVENSMLMTVDSCLFVGNSANFGGAISNEGPALNLIIRDSRFENNQAVIGGAIRNDGIIEIISNSIFQDNKANITEFSGGGAISNNGTIKGISNSTFDGNFSNTGAGAIANLEAALIETINSCTFNDNTAEYGGAIQNNGSTINHIRNTIFSGNTSTGSAGAIRNEQGTINEISNSTFSNNVNTGNDNGGAIANHQGLIEKIINCTFSHNSSAISGGAISDGGASNISFSTFVNNNAGIEAGAIGPSPSTRIRNSILAFNTPDNCSVPISDFGRNYSNDSSCGFIGDNSEIILGPLADNGGPTQTIALLGGDPVDGATVNCDALDEEGNPTGVPVGIDQRYFPRPFGTRCDSGAFETQPTASVTITKVTDPAGGAGFDFDSIGFSSLQGCGLMGDEGGSFVMNDGDSISCTVPEGDYSIREDIPSGYELVIFCLEAPDNISINNNTGEIEFTIEGPGSEVDCVYTNTRTGGGNGGCSLAPTGANNSFPLFLFIPALIVLRGFIKRRRE